jgi:hypothetical protein
MDAKAQWIANFELRRCDTIATGSAAAHHHQQQHTF